MCSHCKLSDIGTDAGARRFLVTLKPNHFRNRADLSRFLVRFNVLSARLGSGAPLNEDDIRNCRTRPAVAAQ